MDLERLAISKLLETADIKPLLEAKVTVEFFEDEAHRKVFAWVLDFWQQYNETPTERAVCLEFPDWKSARVEEPYAYYLAELRRAREYLLLAQGVRTATDQLGEGETRSAMQTLTSTLTQVSTEVTVLRDVEFNSTWLAWWEEYQSAPEGLLGYPTGFPMIDYATSGLQKEQLITLAGIPKAGKSTVLLYMMITLNKFGLRPLFVSFEMSAEEQRQRATAMLAHVDYKKLLHRRLNPLEIQRVTKVLRTQENMPDFLMSTDASSTSTVSELMAKCQQYQPHVLLVDGVYMMQPEGDFPPGSPQGLTNITRSMKRAAQTLQLPIVQTTQVLEWKYSRNRGITSNSLGYTSSFIQDSDVVLGIEHPIEDDPTKRRLSIVMARNAVPKTVTLDWDWTTSTFTEIEYEEQDDGANYDA